MIELTALAFFRIANIGYAPIIATRNVCAELDALHDFLTDTANYRGSAELRPSSSREVVVVRARVGRRQAMRYTWILTPGRGTIEVDLAAQLETRGPAVRLMLLLGGRRALRRRVEAMLAGIACATAQAAEQVVELPPAPAVSLPHAA
jgi:hypothetical protein